MKTCHRPAVEAMVAALRPHWRTRLGEEFNRDDSYRLASVALYGLGSRHHQLRSFAETLLRPRHADGV